MKDEKRSMAINFTESDVYEMLARGEKPPRYDVTLRMLAQRCFIFAGALCLSADMPKASAPIQAAGFEMGKPAIMSGPRPAGP